MKNRFSSVLENLLAVSEVKHFMMADYLQYDTSYISKWINGRLLPGEKGKDEVIRKISECIVAKGSEAGIVNLEEDYNVTDKTKLEKAIYEHLMAEYNYVRNMQYMGYSDATPEVSYAPVVSIQKFISNMQHPSMKCTKNLNVIAVCDLTRLSRDARLDFVNFRKDESPENMSYEIHYSLIMNLDRIGDDCVYNALFFTNMMTKHANLDFKLYVSDFAAGKIMYSIKNEFLIHGMLKSSNQCICVGTCEGDHYVGPVYSELNSLCTRDARMFTKRELADLVSSQDYIYALIAPKQRIILGQIAEHMMPPEMMSSIVDRLDENNTAYPKEMVEGIGRLLSNILTEKPYKMMIYESALYTFELTGKMTFFGYPLVLNYEERKRVFDFILKLIDSCPNIEVRLIHGRVSSDFRKIDPATIYISDNASYLIINQQNNNGFFNVFEVNQPVLQQMYSDFYDELWDYDENLIIKGEKVKDYIKHLRKSVELLDNFI